MVIAHVVIELGETVERIALASDDVSVNTVGDARARLAQYSRLVGIGVLSHRHFLPCPVERAEHLIDGAFLGTDASRGLDVETVRLLEIDALHDGPVSFDAVGSDLPIDMHDFHSKLLGHSRHDLAGVTSLDPKSSTQIGERPV